MMEKERTDKWLVLGTNAGMLIGLILLAYEMHQNSELMRSQISMDRTNTSMQIMADLANGGDLLRIEARLYAQVDGFPKAIGWSDNLDQVDSRRYKFWLYSRLAELNNDWYQCSGGLLPPEICARTIRASMRRILHRFYEFQIPFTRSQSGFITQMQELARLEGLPGINDDGSWQ